MTGARGRPGTPGWGQPTPVLDTQSASQKLRAEVPAAQALGRCAVQQIPARRVGWVCQAGGCRHTITHLRTSSGSAISKLRISEGRVSA